MKTVLVTGGVRGIGKSIALAFLKKGYRVCVTYSKDEENAKIMQALGVETYKTDVSNEASGFPFSNVKTRGYFNKQRRRVFN